MGSLGFSKKVAHFCSLTNFYRFTIKRRFCFVSARALAVELARFAEISARLLNATKINFAIT